ncbi:MAG: response regulator [Gemmatimonadetes bacterium]|nr:response regulator [Gemmatimonadota bacterium]NIO32522.1 response regulator [Gemmatimonadota bacterium]
MSEHSPARILVIEDEPDISALVAYQLAHAGFQVRTASTGREALRALDLEPPDLVVLDLMLPEVGGVEILQTMRSRRETKDTPVMVLTARSDEEDRLRGFELGADDYVSKPFSPKELVLRVKAVLRRAPPSEPGAKGGRVLRAGSITVDIGANRVAGEGSEIELTPKEFQLLVCLIERRGRTQSRSALLEAVWNTTAAIETRTVDMHVGRLRIKLGPAGDLIETVRGFGYRFRPEE